MTRLPLFIAADHPAFAGHFPSHPVVPGVVLLDLSLRAIGGVRAAATRAPIRISSAKFLSMVGPGDPLRLECEASNSTMSWTLRVFAGEAANERLAMTSLVVLESAPGGP